MPRILFIFLVLGLGLKLPAGHAADRPNILWITAEDHGPHLGCYGDPDGVTPNLDALARRGMRYRRAWSNVPVCAPARSTIIMGMYVNSTGAEHMRSLVPVPSGTKMYPQLLRAAGYYCTNHTKEDFNLRPGEKVWDDTSNKAHYKNRPAGKPFFAIFNFTGSHESRIHGKPQGKLAHDPTKVRVPAYHPDVPEIRENWARYHDGVTASDTRSGELLKELSDAGLADDTIVFYYSDHGQGLPRGKRSACNSGLHVPMIVYFPPKWSKLAPKEYQPGGVSDRLVSFVDLAPTVLSLAGVKPLPWMQGRAFAGEFQQESRPYLFGSRTRMDTRYDLVRSVTDGRFVYVRNFMPHLPAGQHVHYMFLNNTAVTWHRLFLDGKLNEVQSAFWRAPRPAEELYDLTSDPDEIKNLAGSAENAERLKVLRDTLYTQMTEILDVSLLPEAEMIRRSTGGSPYDMARDSKRFTFPELFEAARLASEPTKNDLPKLHDRLQAKDSGVRYWAAVGTQIRGQAAVQALEADLLALLDEESPSVRIAAAEALGTHGRANQVSKVAETFRIVFQENLPNAYILLAGLNAAERVGKKLRSNEKLLSVVRALPDAHPKWELRVNQKIAMLRDDLIALLQAGE